MLVDADRQGTPSNWISDRNQNTSLTKIHSIQKFDNIHETLSDLAKRYEYIVVDSAGRDSREFRTGMSAADELIVPFRPSQPDLDTLPALQDIITMALDLNPKLRVKALLTMAPTNPVANETQDAKIYLADYPVLQLTNTIIRDRKIYRDCMSEGKGVVEMDKGKARGEIQCLVQEILRW